MRRHTTLSGQLLALQLLIMLGVLAGVTAVSIAQSGENTRRTESRSARAAAESIAGNLLVRDTLRQARAGSDSYLATAAETTTTLTSAGLSAIRRAISVSAVYLPPAKQTSMGAPLIGVEVVLRGPCPSKTSTAEAPRTAANPASLSASHSRRAKISSLSTPRKKACRTL